LASYFIYFELRLACSRRGISLVVDFSERVNFTASLLPKKLALADDKIRENGHVVEKGFPGHLIMYPNGVIRI